MWETLFGAGAGAVAPAVETAIPEVATQATEGALQTLPTVFDPSVIAGGTGNIPFEQIGQGAMQGQSLAGLGEGMASQAVPTEGLFSQLGSAAGDIGNAITGDQAQNLMKLGTGAYGMYNQNQQMQNQKDFQDRQMKQAEDVYDRNKKSDERRQKLNF